jgi:hypothetical protein
MNPTSHADDQDEVKNFFRQVNLETDLAKKAGAEARAAMQRIAPKIVNSTSGQALRLRAMLYNLFTGSRGRCDLSDAMTLDGSLRRDLCAVIAGVNHEGCPDEYLREAFHEVAGNAGVKWFLAAAPRDRDEDQDSQPAAREAEQGSPADLLAQALAKAKAGSLDHTARCTGEKNLAHFLVSLFLSGKPVDLNQITLSLDDHNRRLLAAIFSAYMAGRYSCEDAVIVSEHFHMGE